MKFPAFQFVPLPLLHWEEPGFFFAVPPIRYIYMLKRSHLPSWSLQAEQSQLSLYDRCSYPLVMFAGLQTFFFFKSKRTFQNPRSVFWPCDGLAIFYCLCSSRGSPLAHELTYLVHFFLLYPFIFGVYDHCICLQFCSELWALPTQDIW